LLAAAHVQVALVSAHGLPDLIGMSSREITSGWKATYLGAFDQAIRERAGSADYLRARRATIVKLFNMLIRQSPIDDAREVKATPRRRRS
jgi:hypothetical protein